MNKTPLTARTNRIIGGRAPSEYVSRLQNSAGITSEQFDSNLRTHLVDQDPLRADDFDAFFERRQSALRQRIAAAMGKVIEAVAASEPSEPVTEYETETEGSLFQDEQMGFATA